MKKLIIFITVFIVLMSIAYAIPASDYNSFYGTAEIGTSNMPIGAIITATVDSVSESIIVTEAGYYGGCGASMCPSNAKKLTVVGDTGDTITFTVVGSGCAGSLGTVTESLEQGKSEQLNLAFSCSATGGQDEPGDGGGGGGGAGGGGGGGSGGCHIDWSRGTLNKIIRTAEGDTLRICCGEDIPFFIDIKSVSDNSVSIVINPGALKYTVSKGIIKGIDLNRDGLNDMSIEYQKNLNKEAWLKMERGEGADICIAGVSIPIIEEEKVKEKASPEEEPVPEEEPFIKLPELFTHTAFIGISIIILIVIIGLIIYFVLSREKK